MANPWFRFYTDFVSNPKVQILSEALRYRYVALLCLQCSDDYEDRPDDEIALSLRITIEEWHSTRYEFVKRGLLTEKNQIKGWEKRQYISDLKDPTASDRQKRYRERKRNALRDVTESNGSVTARYANVTEALRVTHNGENKDKHYKSNNYSNRDVTESLRTDTDTDTDTERKTKQKKFEPQILPDFIPNHEWQEFKEHRKSIKKPLSERAEKLAIGELTKLHKSSEDLKAVINASILNGWAGLFPVKQQMQFGKPVQPAKPLRKCDVCKNEIKLGDNVIDGKHGDCYYKNLR